MQTNKSSRKEREFQRHKKEVLSTALDLFSEKGFHNVTMQEIAKESEFSVGSLYKFFEKKEDIYKQLLEMTISDFQSSLAGVLERSGSEIEKIKWWLGEKIRIFEDHAGFIRLYFNETMGNSTNVRAGLQSDARAKYEEMLSKIQKVFEKGIKRKVFRKFDPYHLTIALEGISNAFLFEYLAYPEKFKKIDPDLIFNVFSSQINMESMAE